MHQRNALRLAAAAVAASLALAACSSDSGTSENGATGDPAAPTKQELNLSVQAPTADLSVGNFTGGDTTIYLGVYDRLVTQGLAGELIPSIAESWEMSDDGLTLTFYIRQGQAFTNDEPLDAAAVAASLEASRVGPGSAGQLATIESVETPDETTVVLNLSRPDAALIYQLAGTPGVISAPSLLGTDEAKLNPVGSGPYVLSAEGTTVGATYELIRNEDHWNADAYAFPTVNVAVIEDPTAQQNAMKTGQLDFMTLQSPDLVSQFPESDFTTGEGNPQALGGLFLTDREGSVVPALADVRVRQAINLAIDRQTIAEKLVPGVGSATAQIANPVGEAYDPALDEVYAYDLEAARTLMDEAGYGDGFSVTMPSTVLSQTFDTTIAQQLSDIGITVEYESVPFQDLYAKLYEGTYGMFWFYNGYSGSDAKDVAQVLSGSFNPQATTTPELEELLATANAAPLDEHGEWFGAVNEYFVDEAWFAPVNASTGIWVSSNEVAYTPPVVADGSLLAWQPAS
ncbi:ABC transporter substrate-binding protein [Demequina muriae]|uniref:ABC transporter substrate-binding protein n=1 Tax=Demequina muriae TaxID=3051664 RepID=A0ABT8GGH9_9MICO|nr:ABC transporter substrate-binding protein [Demequina sp. EGI L300058]MDN4480459.1 ABC transporter substrate-binding protein [Demequina sp. EGI L300058]